MRILLIDNYDSFTYNLVHYLKLNGAKVEIAFNDNIPFDSILNYDKIVLSPGPGLPEDAGQLIKLIKAYYQKVPILGVCLGFQAIIKCFGGELINQKFVKHGVGEICFFENNSTLFKYLPCEFKVGLYHSWCADEKTFPKVLKITSKSKSDVIMAFEHNKFPIYGVQFHPESIITENGLKIIQNFLVG